MGASKTQHFSDEQNAVALLFKALAHPARIAIVDYLLKVQSCICGDIVNELPLSQPTVSQHLKELKTAGIIRGNIEGNSICYCLDQNVVSKLEAYFSQLSKELEQKKSCC